MLFVNSGKLEVQTKDGYTVEVQAGNFVGEGYVVLQTLSLEISRNPFSDLTFAIIHLQCLDFPRENAQCYCEVLDTSPCN